MFLEGLALSVIVTISNPFVEEIGNLSDFATQVRKRIKKELLLKIASPSAQGLAYSSISLGFDCSSYALF